MQIPNIANRTHKLNETYFDKIDTEEKAYWLGFLWADGSICKTTPRAARENRLVLGQKESEREHLQKFLDALNSDYVLRILRRKPGNGSYGKESMVHAEINSRPICDALLRLGYGKKENRTKIPLMRHNLLRHFVRGYFDGDGCLSVYRQLSQKHPIDRQEWSITGNPALIAKIRTILEQDAGTTPTVKIKVYGRTTKAVSLRYGKALDVEKLYPYPYRGASVFLMSKHAKFVQYFSRKS